MATTSRYRSGQVNFYTCIAGLSKDLVNVFSYLIRTPFRHEQQRYQQLLDEASVRYYQMGIQQGRIIGQSEGFQLGVQQGAKQVLREIQGDMDDDDFPTGGRFSDMN